MTKPTISQDTARELLWERNDLLRFARDITKAPLRSYHERCEDCGVNLDSDVDGTSGWCADCQPTREEVAEGRAP